MRFIIFFLFITISNTNCDIDSIRSAYFQILREHHFEKANLCLPSLDVLSAVNLYDCQIACIENQLCRTGSFYHTTNQCHLFAERLEDGLIIQTESVTVLSLQQRHSLTEPLLTQITSSKNSIYGIWNTSAGQDSTPIQLGIYTSGGSPPTQDISKAIDNDISTKHVSFGEGRNAWKSNTAGHNTGFYIIPARLSILTHLCWATSIEADETARDPMIITIEGSNETSTDELSYGSSWSLIYNGTSGLDDSPDRGTYKLVPLDLLFTIQSSPFRSYRLLIIQKRGYEDSVQYSEAQLFGYIADL